MPTPSSSMRGAGLEHLDVGPTGGVEGQGQREPTDPPAADQHSAIRLHGSSLPRPRSACGMAPDRLKR